MNSHVENLEHKKAMDLLVLLGSTRYRASTYSLST